MNLKKRSGSETEDLPAAGDKPGKKPVVIYIMILFIVAFLLMALSFFMHQRSNSEALGELQTSVSALQAVQATQDKNIQLQEELVKAEEVLDTLQQELRSAKQESAGAQGAADALLCLYTLQQQYSAGNYDDCRETIQSMESRNLISLLPAEGAEGVTPPAERYTQLKEAVEAK